MFYLLFAVFRKYLLSCARSMLNVYCNNFIETVMAQREIEMDVNKAVTPTCWRFRSQLSSMLLIDDNSVIKSSTFKVSYARKK